MLNNTNRILVIQLLALKQYLINYQQHYGRMPKLLPGETLAEYEFRKQTYLANSTGFKPTEPDVLKFLPIVRAFTQTSFTYPDSIFTEAKWRWFLEEVRHFSDELLAHVDELLSQRCHRWLR